MWEVGSEVQLYTSTAQDSPTKLVSDEEVGSGLQWKRG